MRTTKENFKGISLRSKFVVHGYYTVSNSGGYEIMISRDGESARVRDAYGSRFPKTSGWLAIEYKENVDDEGETFEPIIDPDGFAIPLNEVIRANY